MGELNVLLILGGVFVRLHDYPLVLEVYLDVPRQMHLILHVSSGGGLGFGAHQDLGRCRELAARFLDKRPFYVIATCPQCPRDIVN